MKLLGKGFVMLAMMAFITAASLFVIGSYVLTWPLFRQSPRTARMRALADLGVALFALGRSLEGSGVQKSRPSPPKSAPINGSDGPVES